MGLGHGSGVVVQLLVPGALFLVQARQGLCGVGAVSGTAQLVAGAIVHAARFKVLRLYRGAQVGHGMGAVCPLLWRQFCLGVFECAGFFFCGEPCVVLDFEAGQGVTVQR